MPRRHPTSSGVSLPPGQTTVQLMTEDGNKILAPLVICHACSSSQGKDVPMFRNFRESKIIGTEIVFCWACGQCGAGGFVADDGKSKAAPIPSVWAAKVIVP